MVPAPVSWARSSRPGPPWLSSPPVLVPNASKGPTPGAGSPPPRHTRPDAAAGPPAPGAAGEGAEGRLFRRPASARGFRGRSPRRPGRTTALRPSRSREPAAGAAVPRRAAWPSRLRARRLRRPATASSQRPVTRGAPRSRPAALGRPASPAAEGKSRAASRPVPEPPSPAGGAAPQSHPPSPRPQCAGAEPPARSPRPRRAHCACAAAAAPLPPGGAQARGRGSLARGCAVRRPPLQFAGQARRRGRRDAALPAPGGAVPGLRLLLAPLRLQPARRVPGGWSGPRWREATGRSGFLARGRRTRRRERGGQRGPRGASRPVGQVRAVPCLGAGPGPGRRARGAGRGARPGTAGRSAQRLKTRCRRSDPLPASPSFPGTRPSSRIPSPSIPGPDPLSASPSSSIPVQLQPESTPRLWCWSSDPFLLSSLEQLEINFQLLIDVIAFFKRFVECKRCCTDALLLSG